MSDPTIGTQTPSTDARAITRHERGVELMARIQGERAAQQIRDGFDAISPDFGRYVVEAGFADVYGRPGLTLAQRQRRRAHRARRG